jgi:hypothetical protein
MKVFGKEPTTGTGLVPQQTALAELMLIEVDVAQYDEYLDKPEVAANMQALVLGAARQGLQLTRNSLDYAIESFGRHDLSQAEFDRVVGDLRGLTAETIEVKLHQVHLACELIGYDSATQHGITIDGSTRTRTDSIRDMAATIEAVESQTGEQLDIESAVDTAEQYRGYLYTHITDSDKRFNLATRDSMDLLSQASNYDIAHFLDDQALKGRFADSPLDEHAELDDSSRIDPVDPSEAG